MTLLDTDVLALVLSRHEQVLRRLAECVDELAIPVVTRIEVLRGRFDAVLKAADGTQARQAAVRLATTEMALTAFPVVPFDDALRANRKLRKIGQADLMIASIALALKATLVTRNLRHFTLIPHLRVENWAD